MNRRMGIFFSIVFCIIWLAHVATDIARGLFPYTLIDITHIYLFSACIVSVISIYSNKIASSIIQILIVFISGIMSLYCGERGLFYGLSMFFVAILLAYSYGIYNKHTKLRLIMSILVLYVIFVLSPTCDNQNRFINAFAWIGFISAMCFVVWFIFKDSIEKLKDTESKSNEKYMRVLEEAISVARDAIELCEKEKQKLSE